MSLIDWLRGPRRIHVDPLFGRLECRRRAAWRGRVMFPPVSKEVWIRIVTGGHESTMVERTTFTELSRRYVEMLPAISEELYGLYMPEKGGAPDQPPHPASSQDMIPLTELIGVQVGPDLQLRLFYTFTDSAGWDEVSFTIRVTSCSPVGESLYGP